MTGLLTSLLISIICLIVLLYLEIFDEDNEWKIGKGKCEFAFAIAICILPFINGLLLGTMIYSGLLHLIGLTKNKLNNFIADQVKSILKEEKEEKVVQPKKVAPKSRKKKS